LDYIILLNINVKRVLNFINLNNTILECKKKEKTIFLHFIMRVAKEGKKKEEGKKKVWRCRKKESIYNHP